jgi:hypothetical protein
MVGEVAKGGDIPDCNRSDRAGIGRSVGLESFGAVALHRRLEMRAYLAQGIGTHGL